MALDDLKNKISALRSFDCKYEVQKIVDANKDDIIGKQRNQLLSGLDRDGEYIRPFYSENPWFKDKKAALRYAKWKASIFPDMGRPLDVPNLYITGRFHRSLFASITSDTYDIRFSDPEGASITAVHKKALGLNQVSKDDFKQNIFLPSFKQVFKQKTTFEIKEV